MKDNNQPTKNSIIMDYLVKFPDIGPSEMASKILSEDKRVKKLTPAEISGVKTKMRAEAKRTGHVPVKAASVQGDFAYVTDFIKASKAIGIQNAYQILEAIK